VPESSHPKKEIAEGSAHDPKKYPKAKRMVSTTTFSGRISNGKEKNHPGTQRE
jgi:hypothetical protein